MKKDSFSISAYRLIELCESYIYNETLEVEGGEQQ